MRRSTAGGWEAVEQAEHAEHGDDDDEQERHQHGDLRRHVGAEAEADEAFRCTIVRSVQIWSRP